MRIRNMVFLLLIMSIFGGCATATINSKSLVSFKENQKCFDRKTESYTSVVDSHIHFRAYGGESISFEKMNEYFNRSGILFANVVGIGKALPLNSDCTHYSNCPQTPITPTIKNDFINAANLLEKRPENAQLILSMTSPDLANPKDIVTFIKLYDKEYPRMFQWMGEVSLIKDALLSNGHEEASREDIRNWAPFMKILRKRNQPITIYSDLGSSKNPIKYLKKMEYVLKLYPKNKIVWAHMGLSKNLKMDAKKHIKILESMFTKSENLMIDISGRVLYDVYSSTPKIKDLYVEFLNKHSKRVLTGTNFIASKDKTFSSYKEALEMSSDINKYLDDEAFRNIALGENYFRLLELKVSAPKVCKK